MTSRRLITLLGILAILSVTDNSHGSDIRSKAALAMDLQTGRILYAKNPTLRLTPASTVKLMTAMLTAETTSPTETITIGKTAANTPKVTMGLNENDKFTVEILMGGILMLSANDAAVALAEAVAGSEEVFVALMNSKAVDMGLSDTRFINPNGLPGPGQYTTAKDLAEIMRQAAKNPAIRSILATREAMFFNQDGRAVTMKNTNQMLWASEAVIFGKTGYTKDARHCFAGVRELQPDRAIVVVLLGVPTRELLWREASQLADIGYRVENNMDDPLIFTTAEQPAKAKKAKAQPRKKPKRRNSNHLNSPRTATHTTTQEIVQ